MMTPKGTRKAPATMTDYRQILVDGAQVGMRGLDAVFAELLAAGLAPGDADLERELIRRAGRDNYIPPSAEQVFATALAREYAVSVAHLDSDDARPRGRSYGVWRGYPREQIPWFPTVDEDLCDGCGACLRVCSSHALAPIVSPTGDSKVWVADPFACVVGCNACASLCKPGAIIFPPRSMLDAYHSGASGARTAPFRKG